VVKIEFGRWWRLNLVGGGVAKKVSRLLPAPGDVGVRCCFDAATWKQHGSQALPERPDIREVRGSTTFCPYALCCERTEKSKVAES